MSGFVGVVCWLPVMLRFVVLSVFGCGWFGYSLLDLFGLRSVWVVLFLVYVWH